MFIQSTAVQSIPMVHTLSDTYIEDITRWREDMNFMFEWHIYIYIYIYRPVGELLKS